MNRNYRDVRSHAQLRVSRLLEDGSEPLTTERIREAVEGVVHFLGVTDVDVLAVTIELECVFATVIGSHQVLSSDDDWEPWLKDRKGNIDWGHWNRYEKHLLANEGWAPTTFGKLHEVTDDTLGRLCDPEKPGSWNRRGMVVGEVQSGKTSNYIGLICKAADAGYKVIVVLAGFHKSLRSQTQVRLEEGFLGYDRTSGHGDNAVEMVGVGKIDPRLRPDSITTRADTGDFQRAVANNFAIHPGGRPLLFVVKKNASVLRNLINWVKSVASRDGDRPVVRDIPLLVIDDEADQGSVDTNLQDFDENGTPDPDHDPTAINRLIRSLLLLFDQHAYVGYTATPFANIFIHEQGKTDRHGEDLFPKSFIIALPTPSNHIGPTKVFGYEDDDGSVVEGLPVIRPVMDYLASSEPNESEGWMPPKHDKRHVPLFDGADRVPPSLREAVGCFVLAIAARYARGQAGRHNSMLVHVTRFTAVQEKVAGQLEEELTGMRRRLRYGDRSIATELMSEFRDLWTSDFVPTSKALQARDLVSSAKPLDWNAVQPHLATVIDSISVRKINGYAGEVLDYKVHEGSGLNVIAVGGDKLSRGLTLEGLTVSYFLRASRMYDTLMQMGRWFGYREGYLDLCRLYTTGEMEEWFSYIAMASDELKKDFGIMVTSGSTPREFGHRVRSHPTMLVTSAVKMRHGQQIDVTFAGSIAETINFRRDRATIENNLTAATELVQAASDHGHPADARDRSKARVWSGVGADTVVGFLRRYQEHEASKKVKTKLLADYVEAEVRAKRLREWTVVLASGQGRPSAIGRGEVKMVNREWHLTETATQETLEAQNHYRIRRLVSPTDEGLDLSPEGYIEALERSVAAWVEDPSSRHRPGENRAKPTQPDGLWIRAVRPEERGLLLIYPLDPGEGQDLKVEEAARHIPVVGFAVSFPTVGGDRASKVRYTVGNLYFQQEVLGEGLG